MEIKIEEGKWRCKRKLYKTEGNIWTGKQGGKSGRETEDEVKERR